VVGVGEGGEFEDMLVERGTEGDVWIWVGAKTSVKAWRSGIEAVWDRGGY